MSIWRYLFDNEYWQRADIEDLKSQQLRTSRASRWQAVKAEQRIKEMDKEIGELALFCRTAVSLMVEKNLITYDEFVARMREADGSDGKVDGQYRPRK